MVYSDKETKQIENYINGLLRGNPLTERLVDAITLTLKILQIESPTIDTLKKGDYFKGRILNGHATMTCSGIVVAYDNDYMQVHLKNDSKIYDVIEVFNTSISYEVFNLLNEINQTKRGDNNYKWYFLDTCEEPTEDKPKYFNIFSRFNYVEFKEA